jgi:type IV pilus assembly protein PilO
LSALLEKILDRPRSHKVGILVGLLLGILAAYYSFVYTSQAEELARLSESLESARSEKSIKAKRASNLSQLRKELRELDDQLKEAVAQLPNKKEMAELLTNVANKAQESGLDIILFRPRTENYKDFYAEIPVEINVKGDYQNVAHFFDSVGKLTRLINIDSIGFKNPKLNGDQMMLETSTTATAYRFLDEAERKKVAEEKAKAAKDKK